MSKKKCSCGDPNCPGEQKGKPLSEVEFTQDSANQAAKILDKLRTMCVEINDDTGQKQIEELVSYALHVGLRGDKMLLMMVDIFFKYVGYREKLEQLLNSQQLPPEEEQELDDYDAPVNNETDKNLN